jgi:nucleotide-binding universal stress UspA family protein
MDKAVLHRWGSPDVILLATNLQDAPHLAPHAIAQAKLSGAKILLVHVIEPEYLRTSPAQGLPFVIPGPGMRAVQATLNRIVKQFQGERILCEPIVLKGIAGEEISALVKERGVDRVIAGTRSAEAIGRILLGSIAEDLLHETNVPVCIIGAHVRPQVRPDQEPTSIIFATSFHHKSQQSAQLALEIANLHQAHLTLLHVMPSGSSSGREYQRLHEQRTKELLNLITEETNLWASPSVAIREGDPAAEILAEATKLSADLIVLGTTGASKTARLLAAGVVHRVIAQAKAPVITLRQEQDVSKEHEHERTAARRASA